MILIRQIIYAGRYVPTVPYLIYAGRYVPTVPYLIFTLESIYVGIVQTQNALKVN